MALQSRSRNIKHTVLWSKRAHLVRIGIHDGLAGFTNLDIVRNLTIEKRLPELFCYHSLYHGDQSQHEQTKTKLVDPSQVPPRNEGSVLCNTTYTSR